MQDTITVAVIDGVHSGMQDDGSNDEEEVKNSEDDNVE